MNIERTAEDVERFKTDMERIRQSSAKLIQEELNDIRKRMQSFEPEHALEKNAGDLISLAGAIQDLTNIVSKLAARLEQDK